jgi:large subunit ribosomal protein L11
MVLILWTSAKQFNARTADKKGQTVPVEITVYVDRSFDFIIKTPPVSELIRKKANVSKGSSRPHEQKVGKISWKDVEEIAHRLSFQI